ncbi:MAG: hypothetical protein MUO72_07355 [Bacteroidales bacterium]|nr:hypothetical protein [Bacteroidales bacterium]
MTIPIKNIEYLRVQEGNQAIKWGSILGITFGPAASLTISDFKVHGIDTENPGLIIGGFTISGVVFGGLLGLSIPRFKTYYLD